MQSWGTICLPAFVFLCILGSSAVFVFVCFCGEVTGNWQHLTGCLLLFFYFFIFFWLIPADLSPMNKLQKKSSRNEFDLAGFPQGEMTLISVPLFDEVALSGHKRCFKQTGLSLFGHRAGKECYFLLYGFYCEATKLRCVHGDVFVRL